VEGVRFVLSHHLASHLRGVGREEIALLIIRILRHGQDYLIPNDFDAYRQFAEPVQELPGMNIITLWALLEIEIPEDCAEFCKSVLEKSCYEDPLSSYQALCKNWECEEDMPDGIGVLYQACMQDDMGNEPT
jgi:hypothetical protein